MTVIFQQLLSYNIKYTLFFNWLESFECLLKDYSAYSFINLYNGSVADLLLTDTQIYFLCIEKYLQERAHYAMYFIIDYIKIPRLKWRFKDLLLQQNDCMHIENICGCFQYFKIETKTDFFF